MKKKLIVLAGLVLGSAPVMALAATGANTGGYNACVSGTQIPTIQSMLCKIGDILNAIVPILIALGIVYFVWGVVSYVIASDEEAKTTGRDRMIFGIIGLAVIIAVWGLVHVLTATFGNLDQPQGVNLPTTPY